MELCAERADEWGAAPRTLVVSGGVAANAELRRRLQALCDATPAPGGHGGGREGGGKVSWRLVLPPPRLCTDNGVMVAWAGVEAVTHAGHTHEASGQQVRARWPLGRAVRGTEPSATGLKPRSKRKGVDDD